MADRDLRVLIRIAAQDAASRVLTSLTGTVVKLGAAIAGAFAVKGVSDFFTDAIRKAAEVEKEFQNLQSKTGIAGDALADLKKKADELGASDKLNVTAVEAAQAMTELGAAGQSTAQILASIEPVITLAQGAQLKLADAAGIVTATLAQFGLAADQSSRVTDVLSTGANSARTTVSQLAEALSYTGLAAKESGVSLEETVAILATMQQAGVDGSRAGTALNSMLLDLKNPASSAAKALDEAGVSTRNLGEIIALAEIKGRSFTDAIAIGFGKEAAPAFLAAVEAGSTKLKEFEAALKNSAWSAGKAAETMNKGLFGALDSLQSVWDGLKKSLGDKFLEPVEREVRALASALSEFASSPAFDALRNSFATVFVTAAANVKEFVSRLDFKTIGQDIVDFSRTAIANLKAFAETARTNIDAVWQTLKTTGAAFSAASASFSGGISVIQSAFYGLGGVIDKFIEMALRGFASLVEGQSKLTFGPLRTWLDSRVNELRTAADVFADTAADNFKKAGDAVDEAAVRAQETRAAWATLQDEMNGIAPAVGSAVDAFADYGSVQADAARQITPLIQAQQDLARVIGEYQAAMQQAAATGADASGVIARYQAQIAEAKAKVDALTNSQQDNAQAAKASATAQQQAGATTAQTSSQADQLAAAQQKSADAYRSYAAAMRSGSADTAALGRAWQSATAQAQALQIAAQQTATGITAAKDAAAQAAVSSDELSSAYQTANAASRAYNQAAVDGTGDVDALRRAWMDAEKNLRELQNAQRDAAKQPTDIKVETQGVAEARAQIEDLAKPTESQHTVATNAPEVLGEIDALNGHDTSSTHTIYVKKVETNALGGLVGLAQRFAGGGQAFPAPTWNTVPGVGNTDSVPASLAAGSFVLRKAASAYYGSTLLDLIHRFASGGRVPSLLMPGERVFQPATVGRLGVGFFDALNRMTLPRDALSAHLDALMSPVRRFAAGGVVGATASGSVASGTRDSIDINLQLGARRVTVQGSRETAQSLATALRDLQRGL